MGSECSGLVGYSYINTLFKAMEYVRARGARAPRGKYRHAKSIVRLVPGARVQVMSLTTTASCRFTNSGTNRSTTTILNQPQKSHFPLESMSEWSSVLSTSMA